MRGSSVRLSRGQVDVAGTRRREMDGRQVDKSQPAPGDGIWARGGAWVLAQFPLTALALSHSSGGRC